MGLTSAAASLDPRQHLSGLQLGSFLSVSFEEAPAVDEVLSTTSTSKRHTDAVSMLGRTSRHRLCTDSHARDRLYNSKVKCFSRTSGRALCALHQDSTGGTTRDHFFPVDVTLNLKKITCESKRCTVSTGARERHAANHK